MILVEDRERIRKPVDFRASLINEGDNDEESECINLRDRAGAISHGLHERSLHG